MGLGYLVAGCMPYAPNLGFIWEIGLTHVWPLVVNEDLSKFGQKPCPNLIWI